MRRKDCVAVASGQNQTITTPFVRVEKSEQLRRALPLLQAARRAVILEGVRDVIDAIQSAGGARIECHWARAELQAVIPSPSLIAWQTDVSVRQSDLTRALDRAISVCRRADARRGGWHVGRAASCEVGAA